MSRPFKGCVSWRAIEDQRRFHRVSLCCFGCGNRIRCGIRFGRSRSQAVQIEIVSRDRERFQDPAHAGRAFQSEWLFSRCDFLWWCLLMHCRGKITIGGTVEYHGSHRRFQRLDLLERGADQRFRPREGETHAVNFRRDRRRDRTGQDRLTVNENQVESLPQNCQDTGQGARGRRERSLPPRLSRRQEEEPASTRWTRGLSPSSALDIPGSDPASKPSVRVRELRLQSITSARSPAAVAERARVRARLVEPSEGDVLVSRNTREPSGFLP